MGTLADMSDLVGVAEIAGLGGVERNSAWRWTRRDDFPAPAQRLAAGPLWRRKVVEKWLVEKRPNPRGGRPPGRSSGTTSRWK
jgi:hypothetical protein